MNKLLKERYYKGFSFVELSISLVLIGLIASSAISLAISSDYWTKKNETENKLDKIEEALAGFVENNLRLPCPADGTLAINDANFGVEDLKDEEAGIGDNTCISHNFEGTRGQGGVVPVSSLQLPNDFMFDGWGRRISYYVDLKFIYSADTTNCHNSVCFKDNPNGALTVNDASGATRTTEAVYVLISHGENGHGAFLKNGSGTDSRLNFFGNSNPHATDSLDEYENAELSSAGLTTTIDDIFVMKEYLKDEDATSGATNEIFDDIVRFKEKPYLVHAAGAVIYNASCEAAANVIENPGNNDCTGVPNESECETAATEIALRCVASVIDYNLFLE